MNFLADLSMGLEVGAGWMPLLSELAVKATVVLLATAVAAVLLRGRSAAVRHLVWCVGIVGVLLLPLLGAVVPAWELPLRTAASVDAGDAAGPVALYPELPALPQEGGPSPLSLPSIPGASGLLATRGAADAAFPIERWVLAALFGALAAGTMMGLLWLAAGFWGAAQIGRQAEVVRDPRWLASAQDVADRLELRRPVMLLRSRTASMPATWGLLWPSVVLPSTCEAWSEDRRTAVLAHEFAHVKRFDCLTQAMAHATCILFWWNPAVWLAARRLRVERERACDDLVLLAGVRPSDYATHLLEIARSHRAQRLASPALVSMAKPSQLESRLLSVLDEARPRATPSRRARVLAAVVGLALVVPLSATQPADRTAGLTEGDAGSVTEALRTGLGAGSAGGLRAEGPGGPWLGMPADTPVVVGGGAQGREDLTIDQIITRRILGVTPSFVKELESVGLEDLPEEMLVAMRVHGVTAAAVREYEAVGYTDLTPAQLVEMRIHRVSPAFIREMREVVRRELSPEELVRMRIHGIDAAFMRGVVRDGG